MEKAKILIVEDEAVIALELEASVKALGYDVVDVADNGDDAIRLVEQHKPNLILMDIRIKGDKDGIDTAAIIKELYDIPIIFSTAHMDEDRLKRAKITLPYGFILKPIQERDIRITIEMALYVSQIEKERKRFEQKKIEILEDQLRLQKANGELTDKLKEAI
jgi:two-component system, response regulator PdtaR